MGVRVQSPDRFAAPLVFAILLLVYTMTANWAPEEGWNDTVAASVGAHAIATTGTPTIEEPSLARRMPWMVEDAHGRPVPNRFPGAMYLAASVYLLADKLQLAPATAVAVLTTAAGSALLGFSLKPRHGLRMAVVAGLAIGLATPAWGVASQALWTHGPELLWFGLATMAMARDRFALGGMALGAAVFTRPHLALIPAVAGLYLAWKRRSLRPVVGLSTSVWGLIAYLGYNRAVFGDWTLTGGYGSGPIDRVTTFTPGRWAYNVTAGLVSPARGVLLHTPLVAALGLGWREAGDWLRGLLLGAAASVLLSWLTVGWIGGIAMVTYRYALPLVVLGLLVAVPALARRPSLFAILTGVSVGVQAAAAMTDGPHTVARPMFGFIGGNWVDVPVGAWLMAAALGVIAGGLAGVVSSRVSTEDPTREGRVDRPS